MPRTILCLGMILLLPAACFAGERCLFSHHDGSFEQPLYWEGEGVQSPYYGAIAEGYYVGYGLVVAVHMWLSQDGNYADESFDLYFWHGGTESEPGYVKYMETGLRPGNLPVWPEVGENIFQTQVYIYYGDISVGFWGNWPGTEAGFFVGSDEEGSSGGHPWTNVAPGLPYPSGWQHPDVVWDRRHTETVGLAIDVDRGPSPVEAKSWGAIKSLFH